MVSVLLSRERAARMEFTQQQLEDAGGYMLAVRDAVMHAIASIEPPSSLADETVISVSIDGLLATVAMYAEASGIAPTLRHKRYFADECRSALLKGMKEAREELGELAGVT